MKYNEQYYQILEEKYIDLNSKLEGCTWHEWFQFFLFFDF
jgi:hypothetical protein